MNNPNKKRLRRTMMFLNAQKPGLIKDPYIYKPDSIMLDLEDAVAENQKDAARFSLYHALQSIDYRGCERVVRINGLDTPLWKEDIRCAVIGGCDAIRSHGGRVRAIITGETVIDIAFIGAPTCDDYGNCRGIGGSLCLLLDEEAYYEELLSGLRIGANGYLVVKNAEGLIVMHPDREQWGIDVIAGRRELFPDADFSSLEEMIQKQLSEPTGVYEYESYWWTDPSLPRVRKISAHNEMDLHGDRWVVSALAEQIVHAHRGQIAVESRPGEGTAFTVFLPVAPQDGAEPLEWGQNRQLRILLADDNAKVLELLKKSQEKLGLAPETCTRQSALRQLLQTAPADVLAIDCTLEDGDGIAFCMSLQGLYPDMLKILMVDTVTREVVEAKRRGVIAGYVTKPVSDTTLLAAIREADAGLNKS